eukprot:gene21749-28770_t
MVHLVLMVQMELEMLLCPSKASSLAGADAIATAMPRAVNQPTVSMDRCDLDQGRLVAQDRVLALVVDPGVLRGRIQILGLYAASIEDDPGRTSLEKIE